MWQGSSRQGLAGTAAPTSALLSPQAIFEILTSEFSYQHSLGILVAEFLQSRELRATMTQTEHHHLFSNITDVLSASQRSGPGPARRPSPRWRRLSRAGRLGLWVTPVCKCGWTAWNSPGGQGAREPHGARGHQELALGTCKRRGPVTRREVPAGRSRLEAALSCSPGSYSAPRCLVPGPGLWLQGQKVEDGPGV